MCLRENLMARRRSNNRGGCTSGRAVPWRVGKPASQGRRLRNSLDWYHAAEADAGRAGSMQGEIGTFVTHSAAWAGLFEWRLRRRNVGGLGEGGGGRLCIHAEEGWQRGSLPD